jgi:hypothetical protein
MTPAGVLALSDERDLWRALMDDHWREGYRLGWEHGWRAGHQAADAEQAASWREVAGPIARGGLAADLQQRRWGPGGREHFGDPRPGDFAGRDGARCDGSGAP